MSKECYSNAMALSNGHIFPVWSRRRFVRGVNLNPSTNCRRQIKGNALQILDRNSMFVYCSSDWAIWCTIGSIIGTSMHIQIYRHTYMHTRIIYNICTSNYIIPEPYINVSKLNIYVYITNNMTLSSLTPHLQPPHE